MTIRLSGPPQRDGLPVLDRRLLRSRAARVLRSLSRSGSELSIALVDDDEMQTLNAAWRGRERPTDVLSFSMLEGEGAEHRGSLLGDVVIDIETAARQARQRRRGLDEELARLLIHGTLHLLGHDHKTNAEAREMQREERRVWRVVRESERDDG